MVPARPLPIPVPLVQAETLESYLSRLVTANHLDPRDLPLLLGMRTTLGRQTWTVCRP